MRCLPTCRDRLRKAGLRDHTGESGRQGGLSQGVALCLTWQSADFWAKFCSLRAVFRLYNCELEGTWEYIRLLRRRCHLAGYALGFQKVLLQMVNFRTEGMMTMRKPFHRLSIA